MVDVLLRSARLADGTVADVTLDHGRIAAVGAADPGTADQTYDLDGYVLLPAPAEPHAHLDKALTADLVPNPAGDLLGAIEAWMAAYPDRTVDEIAGRAARAARHGLAQGCTAIRTHVDVNEQLGTRAVEALLRVKAELAGLVELQIAGLVGFPTTGPDGAGNRRALDRAVELGLDVVGGCPHIDPDPAATVEHCLRLAADAGLPLDLHADETLDTHSGDLDHLARRVIDSGFGNGTTASHCVALGATTQDVQRDVAARVAEARVSVVTLPQTNLFLQARGHRTSPTRGLTAVATLLEAGVNVAGGADNMQDPFNTVGRGDPLETAALLVMAAHLDPERAYHLVTNGARRALGMAEVHLRPGDPAELLAVRATSLREAIAFAPADRYVFHRGRLVARTTSTTEIAPGS